MLHTMTPPYNIIVKRDSIWTDVYTFNEERVLKEYLVFEIHTQDKILESTFHATMAKPLSELVHLATHPQEPRDDNHILAVFQGYFVGPIADRRITQTTFKAGISFTREWVDIDNETSERWVIREIREVNSTSLRPGCLDKYT